MRKNKIFYGWWIVFGCHLIMAATSGIAMNSIPVAYEPIAKAYGFSMGEVSITTALIALAAMLSALVVGKLMQKMNVRLLTTIFGIIYVTGLTGYAFSITLTHFYIFSVLMGIGAAGTYLIPISVIITNWFEEERGLALAVAFAGTGTGGMAFGPLMNILIGTIGVNNTFLLYGMISAVLILPITLFLLRLNPSEMGLSAYGSSAGAVSVDTAATDGITLGEAFKTASFWLLALAVLLFSAATLGTQQHIPAYFTQSGYSAAFAAGIFAAVNGILMLGKLAVGAVADKFGTKISIYYIFAIGIVALLLMTSINVKAIAYIFAGFSGMAAAIMTIPLALWTAEIFGKKDYAMIYSIMNVFLTLGVAFGSPISGFIFDAQGSYLPAIYLWIVVLVVSMIFTLIAYRKKPQLS